MRQRLRSRLHLVHWHEAEAAERARALRALGYDVDATRPEPRAFLRALREERPAAVVVDLERAPSMGRDLAVMVREQKATRGIPLVSAGGEPTKVERVRALLPDAAYAAWEAIGPAVAAAIAAPLAAPVAPGSTLAGSSGTPLPKKLGIKPGAALALLDAPPGFAATLGALPPSATVATAFGAGTTLAIWFVRRRADLGQQDVRDIGLAHGLVDYQGVRHRRHLVGPPVRPPQVRGSLRR